MRALIESLLQAKLFIFGRGVFHLLPFSKNPVVIGLENAFGYIVITFCA